MRRPILVVVCLVALAAAGRPFVPAVHGSDPPATELVSVNTSGLSGNGLSGSDHSPLRSRISADGRYVVFESTDSDLACADGDFEDIFVRDRRTGTTVLVSVATDGTRGNGISYDPSISADGRYVVFNSDANNLVPGDVNGFDDIFIRDLQAGTTQLVSLSMAGGPPDSVSHGPVVNANGRYVAYYSNATNIVPGDVNNQWDVFVRDMLLGTTERISAAPGETACCGGVEPSISDDGRYVAFLSQSTLDPLIQNHGQQIYVHDMVTGVNHMAGLTPAGTDVQVIYGGALSGDGRHVAFDTNSDVPPLDGNGTYHDIFMRDLDAGTTVLISQSSSGVQGNRDSFGPSLSANGRFVVFHSWANNLVPGDTNVFPFYDVFVRDTLLGTTTRVDVGMGGAEAEGSATWGSLNADGSVVVFQSTGTNLVPGDLNGTQDVFVYGPPYPGATGPGFAFSTAAYSVAENAGVATITVTRNGPACAAATVDYSTAAGTATPGADYAETSGTLTFAPGETSHTFDVPIVNDAVNEPAETVNLSLTAPSGAPLGSPATATLTILDDDPPANLPPVAHDDIYALRKGTFLLVPAKGVLTNDVDPEGASLTAALATPATHGIVILGPAGGLLYIPSPAFTGLDVFTYRASDGVNASNVARVFILVVP